VFVPLSVQDLFVESMWIDLLINLALSLSLFINVAYLSKNLSLKICLKMHYLIND